MFIKTGKPEFDNLIPLVTGFLEKDTLDMVIDGQEIRGYRSPDSKAVWIRDYSDMIRAFRYFEKDLKSTIGHFAQTQAANGRIFDYFTTCPEKPPCEKENWTKYVRVPVEADVEYRFIKAGWLAWQATGDDEFIRKLLPSFEKAADYIMTSWYWDREKSLVKRPYTIDTWDFAYTAGNHDWLQFQIDESTFWGYMHGDSSGYYEAFRIISDLYDYFGDSANSARWQEYAEKLKNSLNTHCWNGNFYTHFKKINPVTIPGVDEDYQLSLSNPMNINRGTTSTEMAQSIIREYMRRERESGAFAGWFSIHPPFPDGIFGDEKLIAGAYCNGGIMPLVGGELAKAALENGFEEYGIGIIRKYYSIISENGESYLWYFPDGRHSTMETSTSPDATPTDGWGSGAMLWALIEGVAGITDMNKQFRTIRLSPKWEPAGVKEAEVLVEYPASGAYVKYNYARTGDIIEIAIEGSPEIILLDLYLPAGRELDKYSVSGGQADEVPGRRNNKYYPLKLRRKDVKTSVLIMLNSRKV